jgi:UDP-N-acetylmuramoylalanine-D-glutamate ligase
VIGLSSPGLPVNATPEMAEAARRLQARSSAMIELFALGRCAKVFSGETCADACRYPVAIAITGSNGKTTVTTALAGALCQRAGLEKLTAVAGNIGLPVLSALMTCHRERRCAAARKSGCWSCRAFQLETTLSLAAEAAAVLNVSDDHMDRYAGLDDYAAAKARIFEGCGAQVLNRQDPRVMAMANGVSRRLTFGLDAPQGPDDFGLAEGWLMQGNDRLLRADELALAGLHNAANALAALALCRAIEPGRWRRCCRRCATSRACRTASSASPSSTASPGTTTRRAPTSAPPWRPSKGLVARWC